MTDEFHDALTRMNAGQNVLLTGKAGTGKSTLLRLYLEQNQDKQVLVTAPTGVAALNIGGFTIHRTFRFKPGMFPDDLTPGQEWRPPTKLLRAADVLVVDEISMVRAELFDMMDIALRYTRGTDEPFGGIQLILVGDLLQLPPVVTDHERHIFTEHWDSPYFFSAHCYETVNLHPITLTTVWRQSDDLFLEVLNQVREGSVSDQALDLLNKQVRPDFDAPEGWVTLASRRRRVDAINHRHLDALDSEKYVSHAVFTGNADKNSFSSTEELHYAVGARVMTVINDRADRFVNGSFGTITQASSQMIVVKLDHSGEEVELDRHVWEANTPDENGGRISSQVTGTVTQFPVILAWALTVHKSQGKTIPQLYIDLTGGMTTDGQFYVALSRAVDLDNLYVSAPIERRHIRANNSLVRMIRREIAPSSETDRFAFMSFDGVNFGISDHIARVHVTIVENQQIIADFGTWLNPMSDLGDFGITHNIPPRGLALAPSLGDFWPLLLRQTAGSIVIGDRLPMLERAVRHQEKGLNLALGTGYDISELGIEPAGTDVITRTQSMVTAYQQGEFQITAGQAVPRADQDAEGAVFIPSWAPESPMHLDPARATASDHAWAAFSGAMREDLDTEELIETAEILAAWAISRGSWTEAEHAEIEHRAHRAGLNSVNLPELEADEQNIAELFRPGTRVAFTGRKNILGAPADDDRLRELCAEKGLEYKTAVSRTRCDVLVAGDPASMSTKAKAAREYGKPIVSQSDFEAWYNTGPVLEAPEPETTKLPPAPQVVAPADADSWVSPEEFFTDGTRVSFRGSTYINGELVPQGEPLQSVCHQLGLEYKQAVTKTRCDVLVTDSPDAQDGKMKLARRYGKPLIHQTEFSEWAAKKLQERTEEEYIQVVEPYVVYSEPDAPEPAPVEPEPEPRPAETFTNYNATLPAQYPLAPPTEDIRYDSSGLPIQPRTPGKAATRAKRSGLVMVVSFVLVVVFGNIGFPNLGGVSLLVTMISAALTLIFALASVVERMRR